MDDEKNNQEDNQENLTTDNNMDKKLEDATKDATRNLAKKLGKTAVNVAIAIINFIISHLVIIAIAVIVVIIVSGIMAVIKWFLEQDAAEESPNVIYEAMGIDDVLDLVTIQGNEDEGYHLEFVSDFDYRLEKAVEEINQSTDEIQIKDVETLRTFIQAEVATQYPNLQGDIPRGIGVSDSEVSGSEYLNLSNVDNILFLGDSITVRLENYYKSEFSNSEWIATEGNNALQLLSDFQNANKPSEDEINGICIMIGVNGINDYAEEVKNAQTLIRKVHEVYPTKPIFFESLLPVNDSWPSVSNSNIDKYNSIMKIFCENNGDSFHVSYIDVTSGLKDSDGKLEKSLSDDGLHPNEIGCKQLVQNIKNKVVKKDINSSNDIDTSDETTSTEEYTGNPEEDAEKLLKSLSLKQKVSQMIISIASSADDLNQNMGGYVVGYESDNRDSDIKNSKKNNRIPAIYSSGEDAENVITSELNSAGIAVTNDSKSEGENIDTIAIEYVELGNDMIITKYGEEFVKAIVEAVNDEKIDEEYINESVKKILKAKFENGLISSPMLINLEGDGRAFQGAIKIRRVMPDKNIGEISESLLADATVVEDDNTATSATDINNYLSNLEGKWSVYAKNLERNTDVVRFDDTERMQASSLIELFIMATAYQEIDLGNIREDDFSKDIELMITENDNDATNRLIDTLSFDKINKYIKDNGYENTIINMNGDNYTSTNDVAKLLKNINNGACINREYSTKMLELLKNQKRNTKILAGVPEGVETANKTGELDDVENDAAIVYKDGAPYILVIMSENLDDVEQARKDIKKISSMVYQIMGEEESSNGEEYNDDENAKMRSVDGIVSRVVDLCYVPEDIFNNYVKSNDTRALEVFTLNEDKELVLANWSYNSASGLSISGSNTVDYRNVMQKYTMPYEYPLFFMIDSEDPDFAVNLANLAFNSEFIIAVEDNVTTTLTTTVKTQTENYYTEGVMTGNSSNNVIYSSTQISESSSVTIELTYANSWFVKFEKEESYNEWDSVYHGKVTDTGNQTSSSSVTSGKFLTSSENGESNIAVSYTTTTTTTSRTISNKYDSGDSKVTEKTEDFVEIYDNSEYAQYKIESSWLFEMIENNTRTVNMLDLTKYLLYKATGMDYGVISYNFSEYRDNAFSSVGSGFYGGSFEEKIWWALIKAGYSKEATAGAMGNFQKESGIKANCVQGDYLQPNPSQYNENYANKVNSGAISADDFIHKGPGGGGYGLAQWTSYGRKEGLYYYAQSKGVGIDDENMQIEYLLGEMSVNGGCNGYATAQFYQGRSEFMSAESPEEAADAFFKYFERAGDSSGPERQKAARDIYEKYKDLEEPTYTIDERIGTIPLSGENATKMAEMLTAAIRIAEDDTYTYVYGAGRTGGDPKQFDCSSFVAYLYRKYFNLDLIDQTESMYSQAQMQNAMVNSVAESALQPGDILYHYGHVGIYIGNGQDVEAMSSSAGIVVTTYNQSRWTNAFRFIK